MWLFLLSTVRYWWLMVEGYEQNLGLFVPCSSSMGGQVSHRTVLPDPIACKTHQTHCSNTSGSGVLCWVASLYRYLQSVFLVWWSNQFLANATYSCETGGLFTHVVRVLIKMLYFCIRRPWTTSPHNQSGPCIHLCSCSEDLHLQDSLPVLASSWKEWHAHHQGVCAEKN